MSAAVNVARVVEMLLEEANKAKYKSLAESDGRSYDVLVARAVAFRDAIYIVKRLADDQLPQKPLAIRPWKPEEAIGKVVREKGGCEMVFVVAMADADGWWQTTTRQWSWKRILADYEQLDGSPCGVKVGK